MNQLTLTLIGTFLVALFVDQVLVSITNKFLKEKFPRNKILFSENISRTHIRIVKIKALFSINILFVLALLTMLSCALNAFWYCLIEILPFHMVNIRQRTENTILTLTPIFFLSTYFIGSSSIINFYFNDIFENKTN